MVQGWATAYPGGSPFFPQFLGKALQVQRRTAGGPFQQGHVRLAQAPEEVSFSVDGTWPRLLGFGFQVVELWPVHLQQAAVVQWAL